MRMSKLVNMPVYTFVNVSLYVHMCKPVYVLWMTACIQECMYVCKSVYNSSIDLGVHFFVCF